MNSKVATQYDLPSFVCGNPIHTESKLSVYYPYDNSLTGTVSQIDAEHVETMVSETLSNHSELTRYDRAQILSKARELLLERADEFANLILISALMLNGQEEKAQEALQRYLKIIDSSPPSLSVLRKSLKWRGPGNDRLLAGLRSIGFSED